MLLTYRHAVRIMLSMEMRTSDREAIEHEFFSILSFHEYFLTLDGLRVDSDISTS